MHDHPFRAGCCSRKPVDFAQPKNAALALAQDVAQRGRFFHWELEFPDVFTTSQPGFDDMLGNPPWEIQKPNSKEFFSNPTRFTAPTASKRRWPKHLDYFSKHPTSTSLRS